MKQGCPLSPIIFNLCFDVLLTYLADREKERKEKREKDHNRETRNEERTNNETEQTQREKRRREREDREKEHDHAFADDLAIGTAP